MLIYLAGSPDLKHDQWRVPGEEIVTTRENTLLLAFRIDLDKVRRRPTARGIFAIEAGDA
jgi:hypothetical protein